MRIILLLSLAVIVTAKAIVVKVSDSDDLHNIKNSNDSDDSSFPIKSKYITYLLSKELNLGCYDNREISTWWPSICDSLNVLNDNSTLANKCQDMVNLEIDPRFTVPQLLRSFNAQNGTGYNNTLVGAEALGAYSHQLHVIAWNYYRGLNASTIGCPDNIPSDAYNSTEIRNILSHYLPEVYRDNKIVQMIKKSLKNVTPMAKVKRSALSKRCDEVSNSGFCSVDLTDPSSLCQCKQFYDCSNPIIRRCGVDLVGEFFISGISENSSHDYNGPFDYNYAEPTCDPNYISGNDCSTLFPDFSDFNSY